MPLSFSSSTCSSDELATLFMTPVRPLFEATAAATATTSILIEHDARCLYPSKMCRKTRMRKASGTLHRYCVYHCDKAKDNQKRWKSRQRATAGSSATPPSSSSGGRSTTCTQAAYRWIADAETSSTKTMANSAASLSDDDWTALLNLLARKPEHGDAAIDGFHRVDTLEI